MQQCDETCFADDNCCTKCNPCYNGGTCWPADDATCNRCTCPRGFTGNLCQRPITSCRGYANGNRVPGKYDVLDAEMKPFEVFCDFDRASSMTWTLIQSYQLQRVKQFRHSFFIDTPVNPGTPSWQAYRLSRNSMERIRDDSTKWRMTCRYEVSDRTDLYKDYVRGDNQEIDILTYDNERCVLLEYLSIHGKDCRDCTAFVVQSHTLNHTRYLFPLHIDSNRYIPFVIGCTCKHGTGKLCSLNEGGEDNFGYYYCINSKHRCSESKTATSQTWFGG